MGIESSGRQKVSWTLTAALKHYVAAAVAAAAAATFPWQSFYLPNIRGVSFLSALQTLSVTIKGDCQQGGAVLPGVRAPSCQHTPVESIKVLKDLAEVFPQRLLSSTAWISINHLHIQPRVQGVNWVFARRYQHKPSEMLNQYNIVKVISEEWLTSLSVRWNRSGFLRAICSAGKNHIGQGDRRIIYPQTSMDEAEKSIYHYPAVILFLEGNVLSISENSQ